MSGKAVAKMTSQPKERKERTLRMGSKSLKGGRETEIVGERYVRKTAES